MYSAPKASGDSLAPSFDGTRTVQYHDAEGTDDDLDLALTYDYNLAPASVSPVLETMPLWTVAWGLGVPADDPDG